MNVWMQYFINRDYELVKSAVRSYVEGHAFPPTISDMLAKCKDQERCEENKVLKMKGCYQLLLGVYPGNDALMFDEFRDFCRDDVDTAKAVLMIVREIVQSQERGETREQSLKDAVSEAVKKWDMLQKKT